MGRSKKNENRESPSEDSDNCEMNVEDTRERNETENSLGEVAEMTGIAASSGPESNERQSTVQELERFSQEIVQRLKPKEREPNQDR